MNIHQQFYIPYDNNLLKVATIGMPTALEDKIKNMIDRRIVKELLMYLKIDFVKQIECDWCE